MLRNSTEKEIFFNTSRERCRTQIEVFEHWARRFLDEKFRVEYGDDYLNAVVQNGQPLIKSEINKRIQDRKKGDPGRFPRDIDAILIEDLAYFFTREDLYGAHFKTVFELFYSGSEEIRSVLKRLIAIRNKLAHGNPISPHEAEQCICYTNDFIEVLKNYYVQEGKEKEFNVPVILSFSDSQGNKSIRKDTGYTWEVRQFYNPQHRDIFPDSIKTKLRSGEKYKLVLEVDSSFSSDSYKIAWALLCGYQKKASGTGRIVQFILTDEMVSFAPEIEIKLKTNRKWHRFGNIDCDDQVKIHLSSVLPPIEDTY